MASATISGGVAIYSDFQIAGEFKWINPSEQTKSSIGYYYYDMKFVPADPDHFEEFTFSQLVYVDGFTELYYIKQNGYSGFYVHGNPETADITDEKNAYYTYGNVAF